MQSLSVFAESTNRRISKRDKHILRYKRLELDLVCASSGEADFNQYKKQCPLTMRAVLKYKGRCGSGLSPERP